MEITTLEQFRKIQTFSPDKFIVITDSPTGDNIHMVACKSVKESDFRIKVIENKGKFGKYHFFEEYRQAKAQFPSTSICGNCSKDFRGRN